MNLINPKIHGFEMEKIREIHAHVKFEKSVIESETIFKNILHHFNYESLHILALPCYSMTENYKAAYCKAKLAPRVFASAGLEHHCDERDTKEYYKNQIKEYHAMGFDGIKMLEAKVTTWRDLKKKLNDRSLDGFYEYAEENKIPILMHVGDPEKFWDPSQATEYAISRGWVYTKDEPSLEELRGWVSDVLSRFPGLHLVLAHFYFMSRDLDRAAKIFDTYKNVHFDLTPGGEMFVGFTENHAEARRFFEKYKNRFLYGTDMYNVFEDPEKAETEIAGPRVYQLRSFLEKKDPFDALTLSDKPLMPFGFDKPVLDAIYRDNFVRLYGASPRMLDAERVLNALEHMTEKTALNEEEQQNVKIIREYFSSVR